MKITKRKLRRIIREEKHKLLNEGFRLTDIALNAAQALSDGQGDRIEALRAQLDGALMPEEDLRAWTTLLDAMTEAAYTIQEMQDEY
jgi:hypothetical protein